jgi:hypothetical protein
MKYSHGLLPFTWIPTLHMGSYTSHGLLHFTWNHTNDETHPLVDPLYTEPSLFSDSHSSSHTDSKHSGARLYGREIVYQAEA